VGKPVARGALSPYGPPLFCGYPFDSFPVSVVAASADREGYSSKSAFDGFGPFCSDFVTKYGGWPAR